jgi:hypothetical protein
MLLIFASPAQGYEGDLRPAGLDESAWPVMAGAVLAVALFIILRHRFDREWQLTLWTWGDIRRVWKRLPNESSRTGGVIISHVMGWLAWGLAGACWWHQEPLQGAGNGLLFGAGAWVLRQTSFGFGKWLTRASEVIDNFAELDRHLRTGLTALFVVGILGLAIREPVETGWHAEVVGLVWIWPAWLIIKWIKGIQLLMYRRVDIGWGIAYLCTLEITPAIVIAMKGMEVG